MLSCFSHVQLFATPWTVSRQAPLSMGFSRILEWVAVPSSGGSPDPGVEPMSLVSCLAGKFFTSRARWEVLLLHTTWPFSLTSDSAVNKKYFRMAPE